jgi:hypothetical protein
MGLCSTWKATPLISKSLALNVTRKFMKTPCLDTNLSQLNPVHILTLTSLNPFFIVSPYINTKRWSFSLSTPWRTTEGKKVELHSFSFSALDRAEWLIARPIALPQPLTPEEPWYHPSNRKLGTRTSSTLLFKFVLDLGSKLFYSGWIVNWVWMCPRKQGKEQTCTLHIVFTCDGIHSTRRFNKERKNTQRKQTNIEERKTSFHTIRCVSAAKASLLLEGTRVSHDTRVHYITAEAAIFRNSDRDNQKSLVKHTTPWYYGNKLPPGPV